MYLTEQIEAPQFKLRRHVGTNGRIIYSNLKYWHNKKVFIDVSIKYVLKGTEYYYDSNHVQYKVEEGQFLLGMFEQCSGECIVDSPVDVEGICLYLKPELLTEIYLSMTGKGILEADESFDSKLLYPHFFNHIFTARHSPLNKQLQKIAIPFYSMETISEEELLNEYLMETGEKIIELQFGIYESQSRLRFLKQSTRDEMIRRLLNAKTHLDENYIQNPTLDELSAVACLSKYHLFRNFKSAFNQTPFQYSQSKRLEYANRMLKKNEMGIKELALQCSFSDVPSFSKAFKRKFGMPPSVFKNLV